MNLCFRDEVNDGVFVSNDPVNWVDPDGLVKTRPPYGQNKAWRQVLEGGGYGGRSRNFEKMKQGDNTAKNKQFHDAFKQYQKDSGKKLGKKEQRQLHDYISNEGYNGFSDIYDAAAQLFGTCR